MNPSNRIIFNTIILYAKIIIDMILALWTVPLVMRALGQSDYGLYNLVAGVVAMLTFLNNSMTVVTQRYMSVTMGTKDFTKLNNVYNASIRIHIILGFFLVLLLEAVAPFLFNGFLNIEPDRLRASLLIYQFMIISTLFAIIAVPFDATLNAYEDMLTFSLISISEALFKLLLALSLFKISFDKLVFYGLGLVVISILGVLVRILIVNRRYQDLRVSFKQKIPGALYNSMLSYAGWNTFGSLAMIGKNQGIAVVLNLFNGTIINASYGIANQVNGVLSSFTSSIQKAISPQLMKNEGAHRRDAMISMSFSLVKMTTTIFAVMAIPLIIEMKQVLVLWLHEDIPLYTVEFCRLIIIMQLLFQLSSGVAIAIDAVGNIKQYRIVLSIVLLLNIPVTFFVLKLGFPPYYVIYSMIFFECICLIVRLYYANKTTGFPVALYFEKCFFPSVIVISISSICGFCICSVFSATWGRLLVTVAVTFFLTTFGTYKLILNAKERMVIKTFISNLLFIFKNHS